MLRMGWKLFFSLTLLLALALCVQAQNATYHLHKEASATTGLFQLKTAAPDGTSLAVQSANLKGLAAGEYLVKAFDTPAGVPGTAGNIPSGATISFSLWMRKTTTGGTIFPSAKLRLNNATGTLVATATGATALTSTLAKYTFNATTSTNISLSASDRFYVWVGVNMTVAPTTNTTAELDIEGTLNGNYDSLVVIPVPVNNSPAITDISPTAGAVGTQVTVNGTNFGDTQDASAITFNGVAATPSSWSATSIVAPVPAGANTGAVVVKVNGVSSNGLTFSVGEIGSISGSVSRASDGTLIAGAQVKALQAGALKGTATTGSGGSYTISNLLTGIYDVQASAAGLETQTQTSQQVAGGATTSLNFSLNATLITYVYDELGRLVGVVDPNGETARYAYDAVGNLTSISRQSSAQISLIEFTPNNGPVGASVTLYGTGFSSVPSQNTVKFNGVTAAVLSATATGIVTSVPVGATTGLISVTSPAGTATSSTPFTLGNPTAPTINGFTPTTGNAGSVVTINGTNFYSTASTNKVFFNGTRAVTDSATATTINTTVPAGAKSGRISVTTPDGTVVSAADFFIPPSPYTGAEVETTSRISYGESKSVAVNTADKIAMLLFDGAAGQRTSLSIGGVSFAGSTTVRIYKPDDTTLSTATVALAGTGFIDTIALPVAGTYKIIVDPATSSTGSLTLTLNDTTDAVAPITPGGAPVTATTTIPGQNARLTFNGTFGQRVSLNFSGNTIPGTTSVALVKPDGTNLTSSTVALNATRYIDTQTLPMPGTYTILVDPSSTNTGGMSVQLHDANEAASHTITAGGAPVTVTTTVPGQNARLTFAGTAGQRVSLNITGVTAAGTNVTIQNPDATTLATVSAGTGGAFIDAQTLPATGTYTILVDPSSTNTGSATLQLYDVPSDDAGAITPGGAPVTVTSSVPGQDQRLTFNGTFGQRVTINFSANTIPGTTSVYLIKPDGTNVTSSTVALNGTRYIDVQTLPVAGTYTIAVDPATTNVGSMTVQLNDASDIDAGTITPGGAPVTVTTTQAGQTARLTFGGSAGQRISLNVTGVTIPGSTVSIYNPDGTALVSSASIGASGGFVDTQMLPATGTYRIILDPSSTNTGSATLQLYDVPSDDAGAITPGGAPVTVTASVPGQDQRLTFNGTFAQRVSLNFSGNSIPGSTSVALVKPDGTNVTSSTVSLNGTRYIDVQTLPVAGTYTIAVDPATTNVGSMTVQLYDASDINAGAITPGGDPVTVTSTSAGQTFRLNFNGTAGQRVSLNITGVTAAGTNVTIQNPDATTLATVSAGTAGAFIDAQTLPVTGAYTILVDPSSTNTGSATLTLYNVLADVTAPVAAGGAPVTVTTTTPGQNARLTFSGTYGQRVTLNFSGNTIPGTTSVYLIKPDGTNLTSSTVALNGTRYIDVQTLPMPGTYTILVDPATTNTGSMSVQLNDASDVAGGTITPGGAPVTVTTTVPGQSVRLSFNGTVGQRVSLRATSVTIPSSTLSIVNPDGSALSAGVSVGAGGGFLDTQTLPTSGTYTALLDPSSTNTGSATLTLYDVPADAAGTVTIGGGATSVTTTVPGQIGRLTFGGTSGTRATVRITANTMSTTAVSLLNPDGTVLASASSSGASFVLTTQTLPVTDTYTIKVDPSSVNTGSMDVSVTNDGTGTPGVLDVSAAITPGGAPVTVTTTTAAQNARLTFTGTFGQRVSINLSGNTIPSSTSVALVKPDGTNLASTSVALNGTGYIDAQTLPANGTYTILVDPSSTNTGSMTVKLNSITDVSAGTITPGGAAVTLTTNAAGQNARATFNGTAGQRVSLNITGVTAAGTNVTIQNPDASTLATVSAGTAGAFIDAQTLPVTGAYTILVDPSSTNTGSATLQLYDVPSDDAGAITPGGAPVTVTASVPGQDQRLTFNGTFGQRVSLNFSGNSIPGSTSVALVKPDGTNVTSSTVALNGTRYIDVQTLPVAGTYTIAVDPATTNLGSMTVQLNDASDIDAGTITPGGAPVTVTTTQAGQLVRLNFNGSAGQRVSLNITGVTIGSSTVNIYNPDGSVLGSGVSVGAGVFVDTRTLPATGTYTIVLDPSSTNTGSATFQLYDVPSDDAGAIMPGGAPVTVTSSVPGQNQRLTFTGTFGQRVSINASGNTTPGTTSVVLIRPDGTNVASMNVALNGTGYIDAQTLPLNGTYVVLVNPASINTGSMTVQLNDASDVVTGNITAGGEPVAVNVSSSGQNARLAFSGTQGQRVSLAITGVTISSSTVTIQNPVGGTLATISVGTGGAFIDAQTLPATGTYTILVDPSSTNTGSATFQLYDVPSDDAGAIMPGGAPVTVTSSVPGQNQRLTFTGTFGQRVSINASGNTTPGTTSVVLIRPDGTNVASMNVALNGTGYIDAQSLPVSGAYTVLVNPSSTNTGSLTVKLNDASEVNAGTIAPNAANPTDVSITEPGQIVRLSFSGTQGQQVTAHITNNTMSTVTVSVINPDGTVLTSLASSAASFNLATQTLPTTGTFYLRIDPSSANAGGLSVSLTSP